MIPPDVVIRVPEFYVPASGVLELPDVTLPTGFTKDTWITSIEIRPGDRSVVHHAMLQLVPRASADPYGVWNLEKKARDRQGVAVKRIPPSDRVRQITAVQAVYVRDAGRNDVSGSGHYLRN